MKTNKYNPTAEGLLFWKSVGGYLACVKIRGRWHYVGTTAQDLQAVREALGPITRTQGVPTALARLFAKHGQTIATLKNNLPHWTEAGRGRRRA